MDFKLLKRYNGNQLQQFASYMIELQEGIGFKVSSRGWCYILEGNRLINKNEFDKVEELINNCRRKGYLPIDFVAEEKAREFNGVEVPSDGTVYDTFEEWLKYALNSGYYFTPDWWDGEKYYVQMVVEKVDLVTLFEPICEKFHIPIANSKGWSSMLQRATYARRYQEAVDKGLQPLLLYCGDHDPDGLRISDFLQKNLVDLKNVVWTDNTEGYDPSGLVIHRFGLNYDFIMENNLTWIDNLITGSGKNLADPKHKNHKLPYVQQYLGTIGKRKVEANAIVVAPEAAQAMCRQAIESFLGVDAEKRFQDKRDKVLKTFEEFKNRKEVKKAVDTLFKVITNEKKK